MFVPNGYAVHSAMTSPVDPTVPAVPTVLIELSGWMRSELPFPADNPPPMRRIDLLLEVRGAEGIAAGILNSLGQLKRLARNQERPHE